MARYNSKQNRCSWCGDFGHNKRTCPELKAYDKRHGLKRDKKKRTVTCSWCGKQGHTKRKCPQEAFDDNEKQLFVGDLIQYDDNIYMIQQICVAEKRYFYRKQDRFQLVLKVVGLDNLNRFSRYIRESEDDLPMYITRAFGLLRTIDIKTRDTHPLYKLEDLYSAYPEH